MGHKFSLATLSALFFSSFFRLADAAQALKTNSGSASATSPTFTQSAESAFSGIMNRGDKIYTLITMWYEANNKVTTIIPDILRVPLIDFFAVVLCIVLLFWLIFKVLAS